MAPNLVQSESSQRKCVQLGATGQELLEFTAQAAANAIVVRYSVPDTANGTGTNYTLSSACVNGTLVEELSGDIHVFAGCMRAYPFNNTPVIRVPP